MNKVILIGRLTRDPEVRYTSGSPSLCVAKYYLAVGRRIRRDGEPTADFVPCTAFGSTGEFAERNFKQGKKVVVIGRLSTGSYTNREGKKVYTMEVIVEDQEFAESKRSEESSSSYDSHARSQSNGGNGSGNPFDQGNGSNGGNTYTPDGFMNIPDGIDEELPFP